jgi:hypothetical protein
MSRAASLAPFRASRAVSALREQVTPDLLPFERVRMGSVEEWLGDRSILLINDPEVIEVIDKYQKIAELINLLLSEQRNV